MQAGHSFLSFILPRSPGVKPSPNARARPLTDGISFREVPPSPPYSSTQQRRPPTEWIRSDPCVKNLPIPLFFLQDFISEEKKKKRGGRLCTWVRANSSWGRFLVFWCFGEGRRRGGGRGEGFIDRPRQNYPRQSVCFVYFAPCLEKSTPPPLPTRSNV
ncbi:hypothetical protein K440DRAFT_400180 [Wilcoxina mikolae CBS 423.85]|nr:hypothetical protein K440DRAFT_400180 [Wilcoxina mikolae CBS 423.85]